ncbi:MAG: T9SS type A sorting domain-containing protein [Ignavibacteria bacterium]
MRTISMCILIWISFLTSALSQQLLEENFDYTLGNLTVATTNWTESPGGSTDIEVFSGSLSFIGYSTNNVANKIVLNGGAGGRSGVIRSFASQSGNGTTLYSSFLLNVTSTSDMDTSTSNGDRFFNFKVSGSSTSRACIFVKKGSITSKFQIGLGKLPSSTPVWHSSELDVNSGYLIVAAYIFQSGNDVVRLWINPSPSGDEPASDLEQSVGSDAASLEEIQLRQEPLSGDMEIDGIRVANSWAEAPLPVELTSFTASVQSKGVHLLWQTATEVNNFGFEVQRCASQSAGNWIPLGFIKGNGNSNTPKFYSFMDNTLTVPGICLYRLKQMDTGGNFEYSQITEAEYNPPLTYGLAQNYPNPFNPSTKISFAVPKTSFVSVKIYNVLGNQTAVLFNGTASAGKTYDLLFDGSSLASGVYYCVLESGEKTEVKKMMLLR